MKANGHRSLPDGSALVQTHGLHRERLVREILAVSGPMNQKNAVKHQHYLLTLRVDVLEQRLELLKREDEK
jgi:hypothetical protein